MTSPHISYRFPGTIPRQLLRVHRWCPPVQLSGVTHASSTTISVLFVPLFRYCFSSRFRDLFWYHRFPVLQFDQGPYASLLGPTLRPPLPLRLSVLVLYSSAFRPMVPRQPSSSKVADPGSIFRQCSLVSLVSGSFSGSISSAF